MVAEMDSSIASQWVEEASQCLNRYKLKEAESLFANVIQNVTDPSSSAYQYVVEANIALADLYCKRARAVRYDAMEWNRMYMHAVTFQNRAVQSCRAIAEQNNDLKLQPWMRETRSKTDSRLAAMNACWIRSLQDHLLWSQPSDYLKGALSRTPTLNAAWLVGLKMHVKENSRTAFRHDEEPHLMQGTSIEDLSLQAQPYANKITDDMKRVERQMTVDRVEKAIKKLAKQFASEVQHKNIAIHKSLTPDEKLSVISPMTDATFFNVFRQAMQDTRPPSPDREKEETPQLKRIFDSMEDISLGERNLPRKDSAYRRGVLRIWKRCKNIPKPPKEYFEPYKLQAFEALSPVTESFKLANEGDESQTDESVSSTSEEVLISNARLNCTFADILTELASKLQKSNNAKGAYEVYNYSLGIYRENLTESEAVISVGKVLRQMGMIKCKEGDFCGGQKILEEGINMTEKGHGNVRNIDAARGWCEMGNAYLSNQQIEGSVFEHVMQNVQDVSEREISREEEDYDEEEEDSDDEDSTCGESYDVSTYEASGCFSHALSILQSIPVTENTQEYYDLYVEVLTKLADCSIMIGNYDRAVVCYEEALNLFKNTGGSTSLPTNAHVLTMLGTATYLLGNCPKAVNIFEMANLFQQHLHGCDDVNFEMAFTLTMLAFCFYNMKQYHKCISWCLKAYDYYSEVHTSFAKLGTVKLWFITQTVYTLGYAYSTLSFHKKALHYLQRAQVMIRELKEEIMVKQLVRILKSMADVYTVLDDHEHALQFYNDALAYISYLGDDKSSTALQNQLLNRMANVHVSNKQYNTAAQYLQQALEHQKKVETSIKGDMMGIIQQLGLTYILAGDPEKAIECYRECVEAFSESHITSGVALARILAVLGTLHHVKACLEDDNYPMLELMKQAETYYEDAIRADSNPSTCVQYANFLYQQGRYCDALLVMLKVVHSKNHLEMSQIVYNGLEQAVLPEHIQADIDGMDEVIIETKVFSRYLAILCYKHVNLMDDAMDCLVDLFRIVSRSLNALDHSILGYSFMEMGLCLDASESFSYACALQRDNSVAQANFSMALCCWAHQSMNQAVYNIFDFMSNPNKFKKPPNKKKNPLHDFKQKRKDHQKSRELRKVEALVQQEYMTLQEETTPTTIDQPRSTTRDSGYYDNAPIDFSQVDQTQEECHITPMEEGTPLSSPDLLRYILSQQKETQEGMPDRGYTSNERLEQEDIEEGEAHTTRRNIHSSESSNDRRSRTSSNHSMFEEWVMETQVQRSPAKSRSGSNRTSGSFEEVWETMEETVATPAHILQLLQRTSTEQDTAEHNQDFGDNKSQSSRRSRKSSSNDNENLNDSGEWVTTTEETEWVTMTEEGEWVRPTEEDEWVTTTEEGEWITTTEEVVHSYPIHSELFSNNNNSAEDKHQKFTLQNGDVNNTNNHKVMTTTILDYEQTHHDESQEVEEEQQEEEVWQVWEDEEVVETPPEVLRAIMAAQGL